MFPDKILGYLIKDAGYEEDKYVRLDLVLTDRAYYHSGYGNCDLNVNDGWSDGFVATQVLRKSQIPNGSLIVQQSGYQCRPEGVD